MKDDSIFNLIKDKSILLMFLVVILAFSFNLFAIRQDRILTTTFNDSSDISIIERELISGNYGGTEVTYRYVFENTSNEDKVFRVVGIYPYTTSDHIWCSDHIYYIEADSEKEITVTLGVPYYRSGELINDPEVHIIEA